MGRRVARRKVVSGVTQSEKRYLYAEGNRLVAEPAATGALVAQFVYAANGRVPDLMLKSGVLYRLLTDHLGSVRLVVNTSNGTAAQRVDYDTWGNATLVTGSWDVQPFGFAGGLWDPDTKLVHFGAREYDPEVMRWTTRDPVLFSGGVNLYAYALGDPVNRVDPAGLAGAFIWGATGAGNPGLVRLEAEAIGLIGWDSGTGAYTGNIAAAGVAVGTDTHFGAV